MYDQNLMNLMHGSKQKEAFREELKEKVEKQKMSADSTVSEYAMADRMQMDSARMENPFPMMQGPVPSVTVTRQPIRKSGEKLGRKAEKKRRESFLKERKEAAGTTMDAATLAEVERIMATKWGQEQWLQEKHGGVTNSAILKEIADGNYQHFEKLDTVLRDWIATKYMQNEGEDFFTMTNDEDDSAIMRAEDDVSTERVVEKLEETGNLFNPVLRLGLSQKARELETGRRPGEFNTNIYRQTDNAIAQRIMERTLTGTGGNGETAEEKTKNLGKKILMAKQLLMMHMGHLKLREEEVDYTTGTLPMASVLAHCSRVMISTPRGDAEKEMWDSILKSRTAGGYENLAEIKRRGGSTHSFSKRKVRKSQAKEKKLLLNPFHQTGVDVAIGGLGNSGVGGQILRQDGSCGHVYGMHKESGRNSYGGYLFGYESDSYGHTNQLGHTHDLKATGEKASSFGCQRVDEVGKKYGGRQASLTAYSQAGIVAVMNRMDAFFMAHEQQADEVVSMLCGEQMNETQFSLLLDMIGMEAVRKNEILGQYRN